MINKLKHRFNQLFDDLFIEKQLQLDNLKEYQDRLYVIETELQLACKGIKLNQLKNPEIKLYLLLFFVSKLNQLGLCQLIINGINMNKPKHCYT